MDKNQLIYSLKEEGFSKKILQAFEKIPRENFVSQNLQKYAYEDRPLPIGKNQTISQPYTIAFMLNLLDLKNNQRILEVGSGSGYVLALMSKLSKGSEIYGVEKIKSLADNSIGVLRKYKNIKVIHADGTKGLPEEAPFDRVLVSAAAHKIPEKLIDQLKVGGILVIPVTNSIISLKKTKKGNEIKEFSGFRFVPLVED